MTKSAWAKMRAGEYSRRTGERTRIDIVCHHNGFINVDRWVVYEVTEGEKAWMREERIEIATHDRLRDAKAAHA